MSLPPHLDPRFNSGAKPLLRAMKLWCEAGSHYHDHTRTCDRCHKRFCPQHAARNAIRPYPAVCNGHRDLGYQ